MDSIPGPVALLNKNGDLQFVNRQLVEYTGRALEELKQWGTNDTVHPDDLPHVIEVFTRSIASGSPYEIVQRLRRSDGAYRWFQHNGFPVRDSSRETLLWCVLLTDIDERKRAETELRALKDQLYKENLVLRDEVDRTSMFEEIVGTSPALQPVLARVAKVAKTESTVLITGETGTGKELVARAVHKRSQRSGRAFVSVNCAALAPTLIPSELFGHEKGAFTGATQRRLGRFELADGGTIFLDEVGELLPDTQVALLRVLQEREFERVGGTQPIHVDVRVIAATNRDLKAAIAKGSFRQDLFYRLNVFPIEVPPLRERKDDLLMLVEYFVQRYASQAGKNIRSIDKKTLGLLKAYDWPGNIRELQNVIERSMILSSGGVFTVDELWLSTQSSQPTPRMTASAPFQGDPRNEREIIEAALAESRGRIAGPSGAAARLNIPASTLESQDSIPEDSTRANSSLAAALAKSLVSQDSQDSQIRSAHSRPPVSPAFSIVCEWRSVCCLASPEPAMACRIDRLVTERGLVVLRISGRITGDDVDVLRAAIDQERGAVAIDLEEVGVVDRAAVDLLVFSEGRGIELRNCPPYIREWVDRERAQMPRTLLSQGHDQGVIMIEICGSSVTVAALACLTKECVMEAHVARAFPRTHFLDGQCSHADSTPASRRSTTAVCRKACSAHRPRGGTC